MAAYAGKITPEIRAEICELIERGNYASVACRAVGIPSRTYYDWTAKGQAANAPKRYREFAEAVDIAKARRELHLVDKIERALPGWQAAARMLESLERDRWSKTVYHKGDLDVKTKGYIGWTPAQWDQLDEHSNSAKEGATEGIPQQTEAGDSEESTSNTEG